MCLYFANDTTYDIIVCLPTQYSYEDCRDFGEECCIEIFDSNGQGNCDLVINNSIAPKNGDHCYNWLAKNWFVYNNE